ncbi:MAG: hypothetical protein ACLUD0_11645 [Eubacterium ramulus]
MEAIRTPHETISDMHDFTRLQEDFALQDDAKLTTKESGQKGI